MSVPTPDPAGSLSVVEMLPPPSALPTGPPPATMAYHPPPTYPPPGMGRAAPTDGRAITSLAASILGILLGIPFGLPGLVLGPLGYFLGRSALERIDGAPGAVRGRSLAVAGWVFGVVATAVGAVVSVAWLVLLLVVISTPPTFQ